MRVLTITTLLLTLCIGLSAFFQQVAGEPVHESKGIHINPDKFEKSKAKAANRPASTRNIAPVSYITVPQICGTSVYSGTAMPFGIDDSETWDYYSFFGNAGDIITIIVERTGNCFMDPAFSLYFGTTEDSEDVKYDDGGPNMDLLEMKDDNFLNCDIDKLGCHEDPLLEDYELPYTGDYTLAIYDYESCSEVGDLLTYELTIRGVSCPAIPTLSQWGILILGLLLGILGMVGLNQEHRIIVKTDPEVI